MLFLYFLLVYLTCSGIRRINYGQISAIRIVSLISTLKIKSLLSIRKLHETFSSTHWSYNCWSKVEMLHFKRLRPLIKIMESWTKQQQQPNRHNKRTPQICSIWYSRIQAHLQPLKLYGFNLHASFTLHHPYLHDSRPEPPSIHHLNSFQPLFSF